MKKIFEYVLDTFFPPNEDQLLLRTVEDLAHVVRVQEIETERGRPVTAILEFRSPTARAAIHEAKFHGNKKAQRMLGEVLREYFFMCGEEYWDLRNIVVIPMPLSGKRYRERGYNQVTEVVKQAMYGADFLRLENRIIKRIKNVQPQTTLNRKDREENVKGIFGVRRGATLIPHKDTRYVLLDDVATTGSTIHEAAKVLEEAFGIEVDCLALAH